MESYFYNLFRSHSMLIETSDLFDKFNFGEVLTLENGARFNIAADQVHILVDGIVSVEIIPGDIPIGEFESPSFGLFCIGHVPHGMPLGLIESYTSVLPILYHVETTSRFIKMSRSQFEQRMMDDKESMLFMFKSLVHALAFSIDTQASVNSSEGFSVIRSLIYRYNEKIHLGTLKGESLTSFILRRSRYSRSYVFHIISSLKTGGYISVSKGLLTSIDKNIPLRF